MKRIYLALAVASALVVAGCEKGTNPTPTPEPEPTPTTKTTPIQVRAYVTEDLLKYSDVKIYAGSEELKYTVEKPDWSGKDAIPYSQIKSGSQAQKALAKDPDMFFKVLVSTSSVTASSESEITLKGTLARNSTALPVDGAKLYLGVSMFFAPLQSGLTTDDFLYNGLTGKLGSAYASEYPLGNDTETAEKRFDKFLGSSVLMKCRVKYIAQ